MMRITTGASAIKGLFIIALGTPAFAQGFPNPANGCRAATERFETSPNGSQIGVNYPDSLICVEEALVTAPGAIAIGADAQATATNAVALGRDAQAAHTNSSAIGVGAVTTAPNQVTLGGTGSSVRIGDVAASTAAQSGPVGLVTVDAFGTMGVDTTILFDLRRDSQAGVAAAMAMGHPSMPSAPGRTSYVLNVATFRGEQAVAGSIMHRLPTSKPLAVTAGFSYAGNRNNGARLGIAGEF